MKTANHFKSYIELVLFITVNLTSHEDIAWFYQATFNLFLSSSNFAAFYKEIITSALLFS
jgi:uncharacterized protein (DUF427 family)